MDYAEAEIKRFSNLVINRVISEVINENLNLDDLLIITKDSTNEIKTIDFNPIVVNQLLTIITKNVQQKLKDVVNGKIDKVDIEETFVNYNIEKLKKGIIMEIPSGAILNNALLSNLGPKIPVKFNLVGEVISHIDTKITNYGINNALMEVSVNIELNEQVILPFVSQKMKYNVNIPIAIKLIQGVVPNYYLHGINTKSSNVLIPVE